MKKYEIVYVISPSITEDARKKLVLKFKEYITKGKGEVENVEEWGLKRLAYPIKFKTEGYYVLMNYSCEAEVSIAMEKLMLITDGILRTIIIAKNEVKAQAKEKKAAKSKKA